MKLNLYDPVFNSGVAFTMKIECLKIGTLVVFAEICVEICLKAFCVCVCELKNVILACVLG